MGTPTHTWQLQSETKMYRLQTPATPLFRPVHHDNIEMDDFAMGTNALIAVISYTGYDMEDAMIINKSADERGFAHGSIYKSQFIELEGTSFFARNPHDKKLDAFIDNDGLPYPGRRIKSSDVLYWYVWKFYIILCTWNRFNYLVFFFPVTLTQMKAFTKPKNTVAVKIVLWTMSNYAVHLILILRKLHASRCAYREIQLLVINLHREPDKKEFSHKNGPLKIFHSPKLDSYPISYSIRMVSHLE